MRDTYIDCDFIEQDTGLITWHRRFPVDLKNSYTYRKKLQDLTDSLIRSAEKGDFSLLISVSRGFRQVQPLFKDVQEHKEDSKSLYR